jgi:hypothetical protein
MKVTKLLVALGAFTLTVGGFIATKAGVKFNSVSSAFFLTANGGVVCEVSNLTSGFNTVSTGRGLVILSAGGNKFATLYTEGFTYRKKVFH